MGQYLDIVKTFKEKQAAQKLSQEPSTAEDTETPVETIFLTKHFPQSAQEAYPDWEGILVKSAVLEMSVWVVRSRREGEELARETGHPALLLDEVVGQKGRTPAEVRAALLPILITGTLH
jgi:hypothetical protein